LWHKENIACPEEYATIIYEIFFDKYCFLAYTMRVMQKTQSNEGLFGDINWLISITGWSHDKIARLARQRIIKGAFKAIPGSRGCAWNFRKSRTMEWLDSLVAA
jgi:hypothetical protein